MDLRRGEGGMIAKPSYNVGLIKLKLFKRDI